MSGDGFLVVNFGALDQATADIDKALNNLKSQLGELEAHGARLMSSWDGDAQHAYEVRQARWRAASTDLQDILQDIKVAVADSASDYQSTEKKATNLFQ